jgi:DNA-directed RNA polymerase specialized sigma24 family protein
MASFWWTKTVFLLKGGFSVGSNAAEEQHSVCQHATLLIQQTRQGQEEQRNRAFEELAERYIKPLAKKIALKRCFSWQQARDLYKEAPGYIWGKLPQFDSSAGCFCGWCSQVLSNWAIDRGRRAKRERAKFGPYPEQSEMDQLPWEATVRDNKQRPIWEQVSANEALSHRQLEILGKLPALRRAIACAAAGLVERIPGEVWSAWRQEAGLAEDFPPPEIAKYDDPLDRLRLLAEYLGMPFDTLRQHWYRARGILRELFRER